MLGAYDFKKRGRVTDAKIQALCDDAIQRRPGIQPCPCLTEFRCIRCDLPTAVVFEAGEERFQFFAAVNKRLFHQPTPAPSIKITPLDSTAGP